MVGQATLSGLLLLALVSACTRNEGEGDTGTESDTGIQSETGNESDTGAGCGGGLIELSDPSLMLASEGNAYIQASFGLRIDNGGREEPACVSVTSVVAVFGFDQEDRVELDVGEPRDFVVDPGQVVDETVSANKFEELPPGLFADHCQPESEGVLEIFLEGTQQPWSMTVPLPLGCACC